ncbi:hypothetical protein ACI78Q_00315 [Geodermatophilus sp. SYSU D00705]
MWVIVRQQDWVGGEDVEEVIGPFPTKKAAHAALTHHQRLIDQRPHPDERLWLLPLRPA